MTDKEPVPSTTASKGPQNSEDLAIQIESQTDVGQVRSANEDSYLVIEPTDSVMLDSRGILAIVADGMGGAVGGAMASKTVVETVRDTYYQNTTATIPEALSQAIAAANRAVHTFALENPEYKGMGATGTATAICRGTAFFAHVGDTRIYLARDGRLLQLTDDHGEVAQMVRDGFITPEQGETHPRRNVLQRCLGPKPDVEVDVDADGLVLEDGDLLLLCSDGLNNHVSDVEILRILGTNPPDAAVDLLIEQANDRGGEDNITTVVILAGEAAAFDAKAVPPVGSPVHPAESSVGHAAPVGPMAPDKPEGHGDVVESKSRGPSLPAVILVTAVVTAAATLFVSNRFLGPDNSGDDSVQLASGPDVTVAGVDPAADAELEDEEQEEQQADTPATSSDDLAASPGVAGEAEPPGTLPGESGSDSSQVPHEGTGEALLDGDSGDPVGGRQSASRQTRSLLSNETRDEAIAFLGPNTCPELRQKLYEDLGVLPDDSAALVEAIARFQESHEVDGCPEDLTKCDGMPGRNTIEAIIPIHSYEDIYHHFCNSPPPTLSTGLPQYSSGPIPTQSGGDGAEGVNTETEPLHVGDDAVGSTPPHLDDEGTVDGSSAEATTSPSDAAAGLGTPAVTDESPESGSSEATDEDVGAGDANEPAGEGTDSAPQQPTQGGSEQEAAEGSSVPMDDGEGAAEPQQPAQGDSEQEAAEGTGGEVGADGSGGPPADRESGAEPLDDDGEEDSQ